MRVDVGKRAQKHNHKKINSLGRLASSLRPQGCGDAGLERAVAAYRAALEEWTRKAALNASSEIIADNAARSASFLRETCYGDRPARGHS
jgi:hypothetical protein